MIGRTYLERSRPVVVLIRWGPGGGPRNVLIRREDGTQVVRPFRGLRRIQENPMTCTPQCIHPAPSQAHCGSESCHRTFGGVSGFDAHRRGGRCIDPATITKDGGMHLDANGIWRWNRRSSYPHADSARSCEPQTAELSVMSSTGGARDRVPQDHRPGR